MSVVAWDGKALAVDRQYSVGDTRYEGIKSKRLSTGTVLAWTGSAASGAALMAWYEAGAKAETFPACQKDKDRWGRLIAVTPLHPDSVEICEYESEPVPILHCAPFLAWGVGREVALGVMAMGGSAVIAVEIASKYVSGCGFGVDSYQVLERSEHG